MASKEENKEKIETLVVDWLTRFPIDKWWREKYNVPFGSAQHRSMKYRDMVFEYVEHEMHEKYRKEDAKKEELDLSDLGDGEYEKVMEAAGVYVPKDRNIIMSKEEADAEFETMELAPLDDSGYDAFLDKMKNNKVKIV